MDLSIFNGKTLFVTGATGLIGQTLIKRVIEFNRNNCGRIKVIASVRNMEKAHGIFGEDNPEEELSYVVSDICSIPLEDMGIDYIVHTASNTSSKAFVERPMEIIETAVGGTKRVLELAKINGIRAMAYLSTMEVYGTPSTDEKIDESHSTNLDTMSVRSCYPESKRMCESICASYQKEYGVPTVVLRLTQTFGPGVQYDDGRVFAEFARCAIEGRDIVLKTKGETKREYLHVDDAVNAIFISYAASLVVPRVGEVSRCGILAKYDDVSFAKSLGTVVTERLVDTLTILLITGVTVLLQMPVFVTFLEQTGTKIPSLMHLLTSVFVKNITILCIKCIKERLFSLFCFCINSYTFL